MSSIEVYRFRSTIVGEADPANIEIRVSDLETRKENAASQAEKIWLEERLGKITGGIAKLTVMGSSRGELGERRDRVEDAVLAVRSAISKGALAGGCRVWVDLATELMNDKNSNEVAQQVIIPSLLSLPARLLENAGYSETESQEILETYMDNPDVLFDVENQAFGTAEELGVFDCLPAVEEALVNATSLATVLGAMSGLVCSPRDGAFERAEAGADLEWDRTINNAHLMPNEANGRM
jgi:chaperonin GroEL